ncbi:C2 domain-containing protein [Lactarius pseudohatsudake]|nr:C2 domain-containing protein [Lactarius pseudohatsudake]
MAPSNTVPKHRDSRTNTAQSSRTVTRASGGNRDTSSVETSVVVLRVQVLSCHDLKAKDRSGYSDPYVIVSILRKQFHTPVYKRNLNPVYEPTDATFDFPIYISQILGTALDFAVWDKDLLRDDFLGKYSLPVHQWFRGTAFAFNDPNNQPFSVRLASSHPAKPVCGTISFKVGLVSPPNSTSLPDFGRTYNTLISHGGIVLLEICCAKDLPKWPNMTHMGWDMDPFVEVSIGEEIKRTKVIQHSRNPVWDEQLLFHVRGADLLHSIQLTVIDWDKITSHDPVGKAEIDITATLEKAKEVDTGLYSVNFPTMIRFECYLTNISGRAWTSNPTLTFRASYQSYVTLRKQVEHGA